MKSKIKFPRFTTGIVTVLWASIAKPSTKFKEEGEYNIKVLLDKAAGEQLKAQLEPLAKAKYAEAVKDNPKYKAFKITTGISVLEDDEGNPTDEFYINAKQKAVLTSKDKSKTWNITIPVIDAKKNTIVGCKLGKGSKVRVCFDAVPFVMPSSKVVGISTRLVGVQVIDLVEYSGGVDPEAMGFGEEEGYEADTTAPAEEGADTGGAPAGAGNF